MAWRSAFTLLRRGQGPLCRRLSTDAPAGTHLAVEYCVLCDYQPRFDILKKVVRAAFPKLPVFADTEDHRPGSFEVILHHKDEEFEIWSKLLTGEPADEMAAHSVAELVVDEIRRAKLCL
ncbi:hypothetical protein ACKKBG_A22300 [Auxenochlorella protothecoides x Auxenochlorella symbiontica]